MLARRSSKAHFRLEWGGNSQRIAAANASGPKYIRKMQASGPQIERIKGIFFYRTPAYVSMHSAILLYQFRPSSLCTIWYCVETVIHIVRLFHNVVRALILVF